MPLDDLIQHLLDTVYTMTLATSGERGAPHAAAVYFASDPHLRLFFFSGVDSQHSLDLSQGSRAAVVIYPECWDWQDIRGVQMRGAARQISQGQLWEHAWERYAAKFPFVAALENVIADNRFYVFDPHWVRLVDNSRGFGFKLEWDLGVHLS